MGRQERFSGSKPPPCGTGKIEKKILVFGFFAEIRRGTPAKVKGDRKALPLKPQSKAKHLVRCEGSINEFDQMVVLVSGGKRRFGGSKPPSYGNGEN